MVVKPARSPSLHSEAGSSVTTVKMARPSRQAVRNTVYKDVRALARGLEIIEALGEMGWMKLANLGAHTGIDRTTVYRIVNTLVETGYVIRREEDGAVNLSRKVLQIGQNLRDNDLVAQTVMAHLSRLTQVIKWPCDFGVLSEGSLHIAASTHGMSPMSMHRAMVGNTRPLFRSAIGKALLAALPDAELDEMIETVKHMGGPDARDAKATDQVRRSLAEVREQGYASAVGTTERNFSAIAVAIRGRETVLGAINIIFYRSALTPKDAAERFLPRLQDTVAEIETEISEALR